MDGLLNFMFGFAQQQLEKHGEYYPFAAAIDVSGDPQAVAVDLGDENPPSDQVIDALYDALQRSARAAEIRASGVCADVRVQPPGSSDRTDAIRAAIEHVDADAVEVFLPYWKKRFRRYEYGEIFAQAGTRNVFRG
jgi:hypothetical protein